MKSANRILLPIAARAWFHYTHDEASFFIPLDCRSRYRVTGNEEDRGKPCDSYLDGEIYCGHFKEDGTWMRHTLSKASRTRKDQIEKYNKYRMELYFLCKQIGFQLPAAGMAVYYHFPFPIRWTKKKKAEMHGQLKMSKSDCTNLDKSLEDSLTGKDEGIAHKAGRGKYWFNPDLVHEAFPEVEPELLRSGFIEIHTGLPVYNPYSITMKNPYQTLEMEDILTRRTKLKARKEELRLQRLADLPKKSAKPLRKISSKHLFKKEDKIK